MSVNVGSRNTARPQTEKNMKGEKDIVERLETDQFVSSNLRRTAAEEIKYLREEVSKCRAREKVFQILQDARAETVADLQKKVWNAMDLKSCPGEVMRIAAGAILKYGCDEIEAAREAGRMEGRNERLRNRPIYAHANPEVK
jgi:uncharacterized protein (UPF0147 family)